MGSARSDSGVEGGAQPGPDGGIMPPGSRPGYCARCGTSLGDCETFCKACGWKIDWGLPPPAASAVPPTGAGRFCNTCGAAVHPLAEICPRCGVRLANPVTAYPADVSPKSRLTAALLCSLLGALLFIFGIHRLYLGKTGSGAAMLILAILGWVTWWIYGLGFIFWAVAGIWQIVDFILILSGSMTDGDGKKVLRWTNP